MRTVLLAACAVVALATTAKADNVEQVQLPVNSCYQNFWLEFIGIRGEYCPQERHMSQDGGSPTTPTAVGQPPKEPPDDGGDDGCPHNHGAPERY